LFLDSTLFAYLCSRISVLNMCSYLFLIFIYVQSSDWKPYSHS
jgi:hypothetical protein